MGTKHSFPIPKEEDFQPTPGAPKKQTSTLGNSLTKMDLRFTIPQHIWDKKTGTTTEITGLGLKFVVADDKHLEMRLVDTDELVVVLQEPTKSGHPLQICVISQPTPEAPVMGKWQDYTLYEYATVDKIRDSRQHVLRITADANANGTVWRTDACGSRTGPQDWIIHAVQNVTTPVKKSIQPNLQALVQEQPHKSWGCRVVDGVDPLLIVCFVICMDHWRLLDDEFLRQASGVRTLQGGGSLLKNIT